MGDRIVLELPYPPSVNAIWRSGQKRVYKSKKYKVWEAAAYGLWLAQRGPLRRKKIEGQYIISIVFTPPDKRHRDLGNLEKVISDFCQSVGIIENDSLCRGILLRYGPTKLGARLTIKSVA